MIAQPILGDSLPQQLDLFVERLPRKPYCSDDKTARLIRSKGHALRQPYIQHNPPPLLCWLVFDVDRPGSGMAWDDAGLPPPAWVASDPETMKSHISYGIAAPVARTDAARMGPVRLAAAVERAYGVALGADTGYAGLITKNPLHASWRVWTAPEGLGLYDLAELAEYVDVNAHAPKRGRRNVESPLGRNVALFDSLRTWAYRAVRGHWRPGGAEAWAAAVLAQAERMNDFPQPLGPLPYSEVKATAKSVARWVWQRFTPAGFRESQAAKGAMKGREKRAQGLEMIAAGASTGEIVKALEVTRATVANWRRSLG